MSVNVSSSFTTSFPPSSPSSSAILLYNLQNCINATGSGFIFTAFTITSILIILPPCILVLCLGLQQWWQRRSSTTMNQSDLITYHSAIIELLDIFGCILVYWGIHTNLQEITKVGAYLCSINIIGQMFFHLLTCVEHYLAVVHPITYLSLRKAKGIRIRNIAIGCIWLLSFAGSGLMFLEAKDVVVIMSLCTIVVILLVISFCSLSVLCVLIRPGPGQEGRGRQQVDQSKLRTFYTIMAILGALLLRLGGYFLVNFMYTLPLRETVKCRLLISGSMLCVPSTLVLPLLFLQRAGIQLWCKNKKESGQ